MPKITFVILHYYTYEDTIKCVESIKKLNYKNIEIVIVDNASKNNSGNLLRNKYKNNKRVHIILSDKNLGFANGNNLGFKYAKEKLKTDFIVMCNNDVYMIQDDFCQKIIAEYKESKFAILGPKIYLKNINTVCNYNHTMPTLESLKKKRTYRKIFYYLNKFYLRYMYIIISKFIKLFIKKKQVDTSKRMEDIVINGACIIFSEEYIKKFDGIDSRTFLYYEEPLLYLRIKQNNMKSVYNPDIEVFHSEGVATKKTKKNKRKRFEFVLKYEIESLNILIDSMKEK